MTVLKMTLKSGLENERRTFVFFMRKKTITNAKDRNCDMTVAIAAPIASKPKTKIKRGSSAMFAAAPIAVVAMPMPEYPCATIN